MEEITEVYNRHVDTVYRVCLMFLKNIPDTEDAVQSVFLKLINSKKEFNSFEHEKAWLIVTAQNHCKNIVTNWWFKKRVDIKNLMETLHGQENDHINRQYILEQIFLLPDKYKIVIYLYYYEGYSTEEISKILGIKSSTIRAQLRTGRKRLKISLEEGTINEKRGIISRI